ncbi:MAG: CoA pyrophosphatase, partial [Parvibaculum sp.]
MNAHRHLILSRTDREPPPLAALLAAEGLPGLRGDHDLNPLPEGNVWVEPEERVSLRPAAVLVPIIDRASGTTVLLTRRTAHLRDHAGQVSLPGGR